MSRKPERFVIPTSRGPIPEPGNVLPVVRDDRQALRLTCLDYAMRMGADDGRPATQVIEDAASLERYILEGRSAEAPAGDGVSPDAHAGAALAAGPAR